jgi:GxxExxY protein
MFISNLSEAKLNSITGAVIDSAMQVHRTLGPGLLEGAYEACLAYELKKRGFGVQRQVICPIVYDEISLDEGYRIDLLVEGAVIVELKAVTQMHPVFEAQLISYLKLSGCKAGLLINFHVPMLKDGISRRVNNWKFPT